MNKAFKLDLDSFFGDEIGCAINPHKDEMDGGVCIFQGKDRVDGEKGESLFEVAVGIQHGVRRDRGIKTGIPALTKGPHISISPCALWEHAYLNVFVDKKIRRLRNRVLSLALAIDKDHVIDLDEFADGQSLINKLVVDKVILGGHIARTQVTAIFEMGLAQGKEIEDKIQMTFMVKDEDDLAVQFMKFFQTGDRKL